MVTADNVAVRLDGLRKQYGRRGVEALRGVSFDVQRGESFGLLGPNGAGKTTLMKILTTAVRPTGGDAQLLGRPLGDRSVLARVGYQPENVEFPPYLTPRKLLDYVGRLAGVPRSTRRTKCDELLARVGMGEWADTPIKQFSKGMTQRVSLAQALVNDPELLLLDEPTDGLDPVARAETRELITGLAEGGMTVFVNSHLLNEVEATCTRVAVLHQGQVLKVARPTELADAKGVRYRVIASAPPARLAELLAGRKLSTVSGGFEIDLDAPAEINAIIDALRAGGVEITEVTPQRETLESQFLALLRQPAPPGGVPQAMPVHAIRGGKGGGR